MQHVILSGGGTDSLMVKTILAMQSAVTIDVVHMNYGQVAAEAEQQAILKQCDYINNLFNSNLRPTLLDYSGNMDYIPEQMINQAHVDFIGDVTMPNRSRESTLFGHGDPEENLNPEIKHRNYLLMRDVFFRSPKVCTFYLGVPLDRTMRFEDSHPHYYYVISKQTGWNINLPLVPFTLSQNLRSMQSLFANETAMSHYSGYRKNVDQFTELMNLSMPCWRPQLNDKTQEWEGCGDCSKCQRHYGQMVQIAMWKKQANELNSILRDNFDDVRKEII